jgi:hypothetical protein
MRIAIVIGSILLLAGCISVPPAVTIASWIVDGVSYAVSGKSVSDHAISAVAQQDCATWRLIKGDPICVDYPSEEPPVMLADVDKFAGMDGFEETSDDFSGLDAKSESPVDAKAIATDSWRLIPALHRSTPAIPVELQL